VNVKLFQIKLLFYIKKYPKNTLIFLPFSWVTRAATSERGLTWLTKTKVSLLQTAIDYYRLLQTIIDYYRLLQTTTDYYRLPHTTTAYHRLLHALIDSYRLLHTTADYYRLLQVQPTTDYYRLLLSILPRENDDPSQLNRTVKSTFFTNSRKVRLYEHYF